MTIQTYWYRFLLLATITSLGSGCAAFSDLKYETTQKIRTQKAWEQYDTGAVCCSSAYRKGWKAGYYDVLTGRDGCPPLFPPSHISGPLNIAWHCDEPRNEWYTGFQDGAACARRQPDTHYLRPWMPPCDSCPNSQCNPQIQSMPMAPVSDLVQPETLPDEFLNPPQHNHIEPQPVSPVDAPVQQPQPVPQDPAPNLPKDLPPGEPIEVTPEPQAPASESSTAIPFIEFPALHRVSFQNSPPPADDIPSSPEPAAVEQAQPAAQETHQGDVDLLHSDKPDIAHLLTTA